MLPMSIWSPGQVGFQPCWISNWVLASCGHLATCLSASLLVSLYTAGSFNRSVARSRMPRADLLVRAVYSSHTKRSSEHVLEHVEVKRIRKMNIRHTNAVQKLVLAIFIVT